VDFSTAGEQRADPRRKAGLLPRSCRGNACADSNLDPRSSGRGRVPPRPCGHRLCKRGEARAGKWVPIFAAFGGERVADEGRGSRTAAAHATGFANRNVEAVALARPPTVSINSLARDDGGEREARWRGPLAREDQVGASIASRARRPTGARYGPTPALHFVGDEPRCRWPCHRFAQTHRSQPAGGTECRPAPRPGSARPTIAARCRRGSARWLKTHALDVARFAVRVAVGTPPARSERAEHPERYFALLAVERKAAEQRPWNAPRNAITFGTPGRVTGASLIAPSTALGARVGEEDARVMHRRGPRGESLAELGVRTGCVPVAGAVVDQCACLPPRSRRSTCGMANVPVAGPTAMPALKSRKRLPSDHVFDHKARAALSERAGKRVSHRTGPSRKSPGPPARSTEVASGRADRVMMVRNARGGRDRAAGR